MKITPQTIAEIISHHFGQKPDSVNQLGGGRANIVYEAFLNNERYIVRASDDQMKLQYYLKEQWAVQKARENKVPVAEILEVGNEGSTVPYMIVRGVDGDRGDYHHNRLEIIREMGKYTAIINSIPTSGFGHVFDWSSNQLSRKDTWDDYVERELRFTERYELLEKQKMLTDRGMTRLRHALNEIEDWNYKPTLCHGDMRLKNVLVNDKGKISAILDWELCCSNIAPYWDMSIALHDLTIDEKESFLQGYGTSPQEFRKLSPGIKALNIINYAPFVQTALDKKDKDGLEMIRARLQGAYDLYSFDEEVWKKTRRWLPFKIGKD